MLELCNVSKRFPGKHHMDQRVERMLVQLMESPKPLKELCDLVHLSSSRTRHLFKEETGMPIGQFITNLKLDKAKSLLEDSFLSVKQICYNTGFSNETTFIRQFKKRLGTTPGRMSWRGPRTLGADR
jgi:two-component system response regulator YesN